MNKKSNDVKELFQQIMLSCKQERRSKTSQTLRELAAELDTTENYLSAVENGREFPSMKLFLRYLLHNGFNVSALRNLEINGARARSPELIAKTNLTKKIYSLDHQQVEFLMQQADVAEKHIGKKSRKKKK